jgi:hypothetical protein
MGNILFIFVRWSQHFASFYTSSLLPNLSIYPPTAFPILHLLPIDRNMNMNFTQLVVNYEQQILDTTVNRTLTDDVRTHVQHDMTNVCSCLPSII